MWFGRSSVHDIAYIYGVGLLQVYHANYHVKESYPDTDKGAKDLNSRGKAEPGMVVRACSHDLGRLRQECEFQANSD